MKNTDKKYFNEHFNFLSVVCVISALASIITMIMLVFSPTPTVYSLMGVKPTKSRNDEISQKIDAAKLRQEQVDHEWAKAQNYALKEQIKILKERINVNRIQHGIVVDNYQQQLVDRVCK